jgi:hypothetical protein
MKREIMTTPVSELKKFDYSVLFVLPEHEDDVLKNVVGHFTMAWATKIEAGEVFDFKQMFVDLPRYVLGLWRDNPTWFHPNMHMLYQTTKTQSHDAEAKTTQVTTPPTAAQAVLPQSVLPALPLVQSAVQPLVVHVPPPVVPVAAPTPIPITVPAPIIPAPVAAVASLNTIGTKKSKDKTITSWPYKDEFRTQFVKFLNERYERSDEPSELFCRVAEKFKAYTGRNLNTYWVEKSEKFNIRGYGEAIESLGLRYSRVKDGSNKYGHIRLYLKEKTPKS